MELDMSSPKAAVEEIDIVVNEIAAVGAAGDKFKKTQDLKAMTHAEAMQDPRCKKVIKAFDAEHEKFLEHCVWKAIDKCEALVTDKMLDTTTVNPMVIVMVEQWSKDSNRKKAHSATRMIWLRR